MQRAVGDEAEGDAGDFAGLLETLRQKAQAGDAPICIFFFFFGGGGGGFVGFVWGDLHFFFGGGGGGFVGFVWGDLHFFLGGGWRV